MVEWWSLSSKCGVATCDAISADINVSSDPGSIKILTVRSAVGDFNIAVAVANNVDVIAVELVELTIVQTSYGFEVPAGARDKAFRCSSVSGANGVYCEPCNNV
ncbi:hypothetical protein PV325_008279 [Microctonus aethiopoides]|uniref:Uncharacterized protein n=1 Tax=Microctonus aethiopoides TaxID=144406 RepID=A0AA39F9P1_9HYME|nr:hypothetical protein PV325_008279 [Microctonus aethiopoides]KAK0165527.1 hypothetical protein PV328_004034 [Microctonus aethiopoides]